MSHAFVGCDGKKRIKKTIKDMFDHSAQNEERDRGEGEREEGRERGGREIGERELGKGSDKMRNMFNIQTI